MYETICPSYDAGGASLSCYTCTNMYVGQSIGVLGPGVVLPRPLSTIAWAITGLPLGAQGAIVGDCHRATLSLKQTIVAAAI